MSSMQTHFLGGAIVTLEGNGAWVHGHSYATYSEADFRLGFNAVQMTLGTVAELAGATMPGHGC